MTDPEKIRALWGAMGRCWHEWDDSYTDFDNEMHCPSCKLLIATRAPNVTEFGEVGEYADQEEFDPLERWEDAMAVRDVVVKPHGVFAAMLVRQIFEDALEELVTEHSCVPYWHLCATPRDYAHAALIALGLAKMEELG